MKRVLDLGARTLIAAALAGLLTSGLVLAVTGGFPDGVQNGLANAVDNVGVDIPGGDKRLASEKQKQRPRPSEDGAAAPRSFPSSVPRVEDQRGSEGAPYVGQRRSSEGNYYYSEEYYEYYGIPYEEEDDGEPDVIYVPPSDDDGDDGPSPGQPGEPGEPGYPEGDNGDGIGGEAGPGGAPGE